MTTMLQAGVEWVARKRSIRKYEDLVRAIEVVRFGLDEAALAIKNGCREDVVLRFGPDKDHLTAVAARAEKSLEGLASHAKSFEAELKSREWTV